MANRHVDPMVFGTDNQRICPYCRKSVDLAFDSSQGKSVLRYHKNDQGKPCDGEGSPGIGIQTEYSSAK